MVAKRILKRIGWVLTVLVLALAAGRADAQLYQWSGDGQDFRTDLRVRQDIDVGYARRYGTGGRLQDTGEEWLVEPIFNYSYLDWIRLKLDLAPWGDWAYLVNRNKGEFGTQNDNLNPASPGFGTNGGFVPYNPLSNKLELQDKCEYGDCNNFLRDYLLNEASATISNREKGYNLTVGKFGRSWGQADGLRLMDVINPLDLRKRFVLRDYDELRIGQWMADFTAFPSAWTDIFERIGIRDPSFEAVWIPNVRHDEFQNNNTYNGWGGGVWGLDNPDRDFSPNGPIPDRVHLHLFGKPKPGTWWTWNDPAWAGRIAWRMFDADLTVNGYYGRQELFVSNFTQMHLCAQTNGSPALVGGVPGTGCFATFPASVAVGILNPARPPYGKQRENRLFNINSLCQIGFNCSGLVLPFVPASAVADVDFLYPYKRLMGVTLTRELSFLKLPPKDVSPVLRLESSYEFDKTFNTVDIVNTSANSIVQHDFWSTLVGFDYFLWLPHWAYGNFVLNRPHGIFTSFQMFLFKVMSDGHGVRQVLWQSPEVAWKRPRGGEYWFTFLWNTDVERELIHLEGLNIYQFAPESYVLRQRVLLNYFGDHFKPGLELGYMNGFQDAGLGGLLKRNSYVDTILIYQF